MSSDFVVNITESSNSAVGTIALQGELDEFSLDMLKEKADATLHNAGTKLIIFDLKDLEFINSKGIGFFVSVHTHLTKDGRRLALVGAKEPVMDVISLVGLTSIIPYYDTIEEAMGNV